MSPTVTALPKPTPLGPQTSASASPSSKLEPTDSDWPLKPARQPWVPMKTSALPSPSRSCPNTKSAPSTCSRVTVMAGLIRLEPVVKTPGSSPSMRRTVWVAPLRLTTAASGLPSPLKSSMGKTARPKSWPDWSPRMALRVLTSWVALTPTLAPSKT